MINDLRGKKIEVILVTCIMMAAPVLFFFLLSSFSIFLLVGVIEIFCIAFLGIRRRARSQLKNERANQTTKIPSYNIESTNILQSVNHKEKNRVNNGNIQLQIPDIMNDERHLQ